MRLTYAASAATVVYSGAKARLMQITVLVLLVLALVPISPAQTSLYYLNWGAQQQTCCMLADRGGNLYIAGRMFEADPLRPGSFLSQLAVSKLDPNGQLAYTFRFTGSAEARGLAADSQGNLFVVGWATSPDFPIVKPLAGPARGYTGDGFISKLDPTGTRLLFSTVFGYTSFNAVTIDANDNVVVTGSTSAPSFPVTVNAYQRSAPDPDVFGRPSFAFVTRLSNSGDRILHSSFLGNRHSPCSGGSVCIGRYGATFAQSIAIGSDGSITIGGGTTTDQFPVTPGAFQTVCKCTSRQPRAPLPTGFIARFSMDLSALLWSTYFGGSGFATYGDSVSALALTADGAVVVTGVAGSQDFPVTAGAFQTRKELESRPNPSGFVARLGPSGRALAFASYIGGHVTSGPGLWLDAEERAWITGRTASRSSFPVLPDSLELGDDFVIGLTSDGAKPVAIQLRPNGSAGRSIARDPQGGLILLGPTGSVVRIPAVGPADTAVLGQANAAGYAVSNHVAPGEIVSLYGTALGPGVGEGAKLDSNGRIATELAGVQVLFDGTPAPLLYVGLNQINVVVPFEVAGKSTTSVHTLGPDGSSNAFDLAVVPVDPQIFGTNGYAAAFNQDGSINSEANPAAPGSVLAFYVNGAGLFDANFADGLIVASPLPKPLLPVSARFDNAAAEVVYSGAAPGIVAGVLQVNIGVPPTIVGSYHTVTVKVGDSASSYLRIAAQ